MPSSIYFHIEWFFYHNPTYISSPDKIQTSLNYPTIIYGHLLFLENYLQRWTCSIALLSSKVTTNHMWILRIWNVVGETEEMNSVLGNWGHFWSSSYQCGQVSGALQVTCLSACSVMATFRPLVGPRARETRILSATMWPLWCGPMESFAHMWSDFSKSWICQATSLSQCQLESLMQDCTCILAKETRESSQSVAWLQPGKSWSPLTSVSASHWCPDGPIWVPSWPHASIPVVLMLTLLLPAAEQGELSATLPTPLWFS